MVTLQRTISQEIDNLRTGEFLTIEWYTYGTQHKYTFKGNPRGRVAAHKHLEKCPEWATHLNATVVRPITFEALAPEIHITLAGPNRGSREICWREASPERGTE